MAFSALRSFYARAGYSAAPRLPVTRPGYRRPEAGVCHRQIIPATGFQGVHGFIQCGQVQINGQRLSGLRFLLSALLPGQPSPPVSAFHLPFWWRGDIDDGFPAPGRCFPFRFPFQCQYRSFLLCHDCPDLCENMSSVVETTHYDIKLTSTTSDILIPTIKDVFKPLRLYCRHTFKNAPS